MPNPNVVPVEEITNVRKQLWQADASLVKLENAIKKVDPYKIKDCVIDSFRKTERACHLLRSSANVILSNSETEKMFSSDGKDNGYTIELIDSNVIHIQMPSLLPHYRYGQTSTVNEPLYVLIKNFTKKHKERMPRYTRVVCVFVNKVTSLNDKHTRDNDNYDYKQIVNTLSYHLLIDDGCKQLSTFNTSVKSDKNCTEIYVIPFEKFPVWLQQRPDVVT